MAALFSDMQGYLSFLSICIIHVCLFLLCHFSERFYVQLSAPLNSLNLHTQVMTVSYKCLFLGLYPKYVCTTRMDRYSTSVLEPHQCGISRTRQSANGEYLGTRPLLQE